MQPVEVAVVPAARQALEGLSAALPVASGLAALGALELLGPGHGRPDRRSSAPAGGGIRRSGTRRPLLVPPWGLATLTRSSVEVCARSRPSAVSASCSAAWTAVGHRAARRVRGLGALVEVAARQLLAPIVDPPLHPLGCAAGRDAGFVVGKRRPRPVSHWVQGARL